MCEEIAFSDTRKLETNLRKYLSFQMAGQIDMNMQSDLMAAFEESL